MARFFRSPTGIRTEEDDNQSYALVSDYRPISRGPRGD